MTCCRQLESRSRRNCFLAQLSDSCRFVRIAVTASVTILQVLVTTFDISWMIGERMAGTAGPMAFNMTRPEEVPTGRIDPLLIAHVPKQTFGEG